MQPVRAALDPVKAPISKAILCIFQNKPNICDIISMHISIHVATNKPIKSQK